MSKELIDIEMPDGTIISGVPSGTSKQEVLTRYQKMQGPSPTLLESRRETSRMEFERNQPAYRPGEAILGLTESFGVDPASPLLGTVKNLFGAGLETAKAQATGRLPFHMIQQGVNMVRGAAEGPSKIAEGYQTSDPSRMLEGVGQTVGTLAQAAPIAAQAPTAARAGLKAVTTPGNLLKRAEANRAPFNQFNRLRDDAIATTTGGLAGSVIGGPIGGLTGAALTEGANVIRQSRPFRHAKANLQERVAAFMRNKSPYPVTPAEITAQTADEASRLQQAGPLPREPLPTTEATPRIQPPGVPAATQQWLDDLRQQQQVLNTPDPVDFQTKPSMEPGPEIPMTRQPVPTTASTGPNLALIEKGIVGVNPVTKRPNTMTRAAAEPVQLFTAEGVTTSIGKQLPELVPEIVGVTPGPKFDAGLVKGLNRMWEGIEAADKLVPDGTVVSGKPIVDGLQSLADEAASYGNKHLANAIQKKVDSWAALGDSIPWPTFRDAKRKFFKEGNADINKPTMRRAYGVLMEASKSIGGEVGETIAAANARYSTVRKVIDAAGIDPVTGRRPGKSVGKVDQVKAIQQSVPDLMTTLESLEGGSPGMPITTRALRDALGPNYEAAIKAAVKEGKVVVHRVDAGGGRTPAQRAADGLIELDGNWYVAVSRRQQ